MPYSNYHACRICNPEEFQDDSFVTLKREHEGKEYSVIAGKLKDEDSLTEQSYRYSKEIWEEGEAKSHCEGHGGFFESAKETNEPGGDESTENRLEFSTETQQNFEAEYVENDTDALDNDYDIYDESDAQLSLESDSITETKTGEEELSEVLIYADVDDYLLERIAHRKSVKLRINSFGGDFFVGLALSAMLPEKDSVAVVEGIAASAATLIASSCKLTLMYSSSYYAIHNPFSLYIGDYRDFYFIGELLDKFANTAAQLYSRFAALRGKNISVAKFRELMDNETWFTAEEAVKFGLVDGVLEQKAEFKITQSIVKFKKIPEPLLREYYSKLKEICGG